jgi:hypothetical protein
MQQSPRLIGLKMHGWIAGHGNIGGKPVAINGLLATLRRIAELLD